MIRFVPVVVVCATMGAWPAFAQQGPEQAALDRLRADVYEWGAVLVIGEQRQEGGAVVLDRVRLAPRPDQGGNWGLSLGQVRVDVDSAGWLELAPSGPVVWQSQGAEVWRIEGTGLSARLAGAGAEDTRAGWGLGVEQGVLTYSAAPWPWRATASGVRYTGEETDRANAAHRLRADSIKVAVDGGRAPGWEGQVDGLDAHLDLQSGGYLETLPWMAAIEAGMAADVGVEWRGLEVSGVESAAVLGTPFHQIRTQGVRVSGRHGGDGVSLDWTVAGVSALGPTIVDSATASGTLAVPVHPTQNPRPVRLKAGVDSVLVQGTYRWPVVLSVDMVGEAVLDKAWSVYNPATEGVVWRSFQSVFAPKQIRLNQAEVSVDGAGVEITGSAQMAAAGPEGQFSASSTGTLPVLEVLAHAAIVTPGLAAAVESWLEGVFGSDKGAAPQRVDVVVRPGGVFVGPTRLWPRF